MLTRLRAVVRHLHWNASMSSVTHNTNEACCTIPPVQSNYTPKGAYKSYAGFHKVGGDVDIAIGR
jgi:hypothetical protein